MNPLRAIDETTRQRLAAGDRSPWSRLALQTTTRLAKVAYASPLSPTPSSPNSAISRILTRGAVFVDGGANLGQMSRIASVSVGAAGEVHSFEPHPHVFASLQNCMRGGGFDNVRCNNLALSSEPGTLTLFLAENGVSSSLSRAYLDQLELPSSGEARVAVTALDQYAAANMSRPPDLVKLDLEGHELEALRGAVQVIAEAAPIFICEATTIAPVGDMIGFMLAKGYEARQLGSTGTLTDSFKPSTHVDIVFVHPRSRLRARAERG